jgi:rhodanese-related sulfurtransferase
LLTDDTAEMSLTTPEIQPHEVRDRRRAGEDIFLLDVREREEVAHWAYPDAVNIPLGELGDRVREVPTDRVVVVACHTGGRSAAATEALVRAGFSAQNLAGGAVAWAASER